MKNIRFQKYFHLALFVSLISISCKHSIDALTPTDPDVMPPAVVIISPTSGSKVSNIVSIQCFAAQKEGLKMVELIVDGKATGVTDSTEPYILDWNTTNYENGSEHIISIRSHGFNNIFIDNNPITLIVSNAPDINRIVYQNTSFLISWSMSFDDMFKSYTLYESYFEDMRDEKEIYSTTFRNDKSYVVRGVGKDEFRYYKIIVTDLDGEKVESAVKRGSSYPNIVFVSTRDGSQDIFIMDVDGENQTNLTNSYYSDTNPLFSPDGSKIAYFSQRDSDWKLYIMDIDGSNQTKLADDLSWNGMHQFSPDGSKIVFISEMNGRHDIGMVSSSGNFQTSLTKYPGTVFDPQFSPDGSKIVYSYRDESLLEDIYLIDINGSNRTKLTDSGANVTPQFSPDGSKIVFVSSRQYPNFQIYIMDSDGTNQKDLTRRRGWDSHQQFSPDGSKIAFVSNPIQSDEDFDLYIMDSDGNNRINLTNGIGDNLFPHFSHDGSKIVFNSRTGENNEIFITGINGNNKINLTNNPYTDVKPKFQPRN